MVGVVIWQGRTIGSKLGALALGLILGGAVGNLIDRAFRAGSGGFFSGAVVDFIDFQWYPIFNIADIGVVVGGILLVAVSLRQPDPGSEDGSQPEDGSQTEDGAANTGPDTERA